MERTSMPRWLDALLAGWIVLVATLYFVQFLPLVNEALAIVRRLLPFS